MIRRRLVLLATVLAIVGTSFSAPAAGPATLSQRNDASNALSWSGTIVRPEQPCATDVAGLILVNPPQQLNAACGADAPDQLPADSDAHSFSVKIGSARKARVTTYIIWDSAEDLDALVTDASGNVVASGAAGPGDWEIMSYDVTNNKTYTVTVVGRLNANTAYRAYTWVRSTSGRNFNGPGRLRYPKKNIFATVDIPINVVFVGFDAAEVAEHRQRVLDQIPPKFRPVIRVGAFNGGNGLVRREPYRDTFLGSEANAAEFEPIEYRYKPRIISATEPYSKQFFAAAKRVTSSGDYQLPFDREYVERYNRRAGALRGPDAQVLPNEKIDFVDGMKLEDWVAKNPPAGLNFDLRKPANGYTYFVVDSFRPSYAADSYNPNRFHNFKVMNSLTVDPDSGLQNGIDWARVWGGRYRFLMLDVGAAPNSWEADVTLANTRNFRVAGNGDSSKHDPPIWHYQAPLDVPGALGLPRDVAAPVEGLEGFYDRIGEDVQMAIWMRFTRGYLYRPGAYDKFILAGNTWHDADAYTPWPSQLDKLYKPAIPLQRYRELIPYATWQSFSKYKYLTKTDPEQMALDAGKQRSISGLPVPFAVNPYPMMNLVNRNRAKYAPIVPGAFTVPVINVVFPTMHTWSLPAVVGGVAVGEDGEPWGQIQNVNDRQKTFQATGSVTDSGGTRHDPVVPDVRRNVVETIPGGLDNVGRFGFTATALHEAGHFFGLSHNHDAVAYDWRLSPEAADPSKPNGYYSVIDWMYTTTATPMGYGWEYNKFEVLDKDNIWIGHALEWLTQAQESLVDAYAALDSRRITRLTPAVAKAKAATESVMSRSIAALKGGRYLEAVTLAQQAKRVALGSVASAMAPVRARGEIGRAGIGSGSAGIDSMNAPLVNGVAPLAANGSGQSANAPWLLITALALGVLFTLRASRPRVRPVRVQIRPPKDRGA